MTTTRRDSADLAADIIITIAEAISFTLFFGMVAVWWVLT